MKGMVFDIQRFSIHDGPGIRTTVFFKGCPLRCVWCHNPEGMASKPQLSFLPEKCIGCGYCFQHCPRRLHALVDGRHAFNRAGCAVCGLCARECYAGALELVGREMTADEILAEVLKDMPFYRNSGGGMTLSGGEPLFQVEFAEALLAGAKKAGLHCAVETCGGGDWPALERLAALTDLFLYDIKDMDHARHLEFTGVSNEGILANLRALHDRGAAIRIRLPVIPGYNDRPDHFEGVARLCRELPRLLGVEILPYHVLGESKIARFGLNHADRPKVAAPNKQTGTAWVDDLRRRGVDMVND